MHELLHFTTISAVVGLPALGVGLGQGRVSAAALTALDRQPAIHDMINRMTIISLALSETSALLGVVVGVLMLMEKISIAPLPCVGIICALALPGFLVGLVSSLPSMAALQALARQPLFASKILQLLPIAQTMIQTPVIFGFISALLIRNQAIQAVSLADSVRLCASGLSIGIGSVGPLIGLSYFAQYACIAPGLNRASHESIRTFTFISQALIEAPILFSVIISLLLAMTSGRSGGATLSEPIAFLAIACAMGLTTLGVGISSGRTAASAAQNIAQYPHLYTQISRASILSQTFIDTCAIYGLLISIILFLAR